MTNVTTLQSAVTSINSVISALESAASPPVVTAVSPTSGTEGSLVTITGTGFTGATGVMFTSNGDPTLSAEYTVNSDTQITALVPNGSGTVDIDVFVPQSTSGNQFTY